jgi:hypothetical protein
MRMATASLPSSGASPTLGAGVVPVRRASEAPVGGAQVQLVTEVRQEIQSLVAEITRLAAEDIEPGDFFHGFLTRVVAAMAAVGGAAWKRDAQGQVELLAEMNLASAGVDPSSAGRGSHAQLPYHLAALPANSLQRIQRLTC